MCLGTEFHSEQVLDNQVLTPSRYRPTIVYQSFCALRPTSKSVKQTLNQQGHNIKNTQCSKSNLVHGFNEAQIRFAVHLKVQFKNLLGQRMAVFNEGIMVDGKKCHWNPTT